MSSGTNESRRRVRVGVVYGGRSAEHAVSVESARALIANMDPQKYDVVPIGIDHGGRWFIGTAPDRFVEAAPDAGRVAGAEAAPGEGRAATADPAPAGPEGQDPSGTSGLPAPVPDDGAIFLADRFRCQDDAGGFDVIFPLVHGTFGEDGTLQGLLEMAGIPFVGSAVLGSSLCMDKWAQKLAALGSEVPTVPYVGFRRVEYRKDPEAVIRKIEDALGYPVFVKPSNSGSSRGINKASDRAGLESAIEEALTLDLRIVVEKGLDCREIEVAVLGNEEPRVSSVGEILPQKEWYDFEAKYGEGGMKLEVPAAIPDEVARRVTELAVQVFTLFDCSGLARIDFFLDRDSGELYLNEINTIPGFTAMSVYSKLWESSGIGYQDLVDQLIELAIQRHASRPQDYSMSR